MAAATFSSGLRWAAGGWTFFIAENLILSENRTWLIQELGDDGYHGVYGACSTAACASIAYAYWRKLPAAASAGPTLGIYTIPAFTCMALGLTMASQTLPKIQPPIEYVDAPTAKHQQQQDLNTNRGSPQANSNSSGFKVRCPFDFTDGPKENEVYGVERISRHPGLWSMALVCLGQGLLVANASRRVWWSMPVFVAWIGGDHTDSRYRRGMGGYLYPERDAQTSNFPFIGLIKTQAWGSLFSELKPWNALLATAAAALWVSRRRPIPKSVLAGVAPR